METGFMNRIAQQLNTLKVGALVSPCRVFADIPDEKAIAYKMTTPVFRICLIGTSGFQAVRIDSECKHEPSDENKLMDFELLPFRTTVHRMVWHGDASHDDDDGWLASQWSCDVDLGCHAFNVTVNLFKRFFACKTGNDMTRIIFSFLNPVVNGTASNVQKSLHS
jgi:hypothetical protein